MIAFLGRYDDDAISTTRTIDGCCRDIFQHLYTVDISWIDER